MMRLYVAMLAAALLAGCIDSPTVPECVPAPFTVAEVRGDTILTSTGLSYIDGDAGTGAAMDWCDLIAVHYTGFLLDGTQFDSSLDRGQPEIFMPGFTGLIDGFEQGVIGLRTGGTRRLIIPPELGFGSEPRHNQAGEVVVPGNSTVVYDIEVLEIAVQGSG